MNRKKKWIVAAVVLLAAGVLICGITFAAIGFDFSKLDSGNYETNTYLVNETFDDISIQTDVDDIAFELSEDGSCKVVCREKEEKKHEVRVKEQALLITSAAKENWLNFDFFGFQGPSVTVYLPEQTYRALTIDAGTGNVKVPAELTFDTIHISISTGEIDCCASAEQTVELKATTGDIRAEGFSAGDIFLSVSTGSIHAVSLQSEGSVDAHVTTGDAKLESVSCTDLYSDGSTGDLIMKDVTASGEFHLERSTGDIRFDACDAGTIFAKTSTGSVSGTLLSGKIFITDTGVGDVDVPATTEGGKCEIRTSTGDIHIWIQD